MKEFKVKAKVLNLGLGERIVTRSIFAVDEKDAANKFIEKYLTIEVLEVAEI